MKTPLLRSATLARRHAGAAVLALVAGAAFAHTTPAAHGDHHASRGAHHPAAMQQHVDRHLTELKQSLQLTPAQEPAWAQFASAMRPAGKPPARPDPAAMASMTTPQRLEQMQAMRQQHQAEMDKRMSAIRGFYAVLTPEQQKRFDAQAMRHMGGHEGKRDGHRHHG